MNRAHESPDDPRPDVGHSVHEERLQDIERQLRKARPALPQLDLAAIERLARETPPSVDEPHVVLKQTREYERARPLRRYGTIAGSWICGALVGAVAMFLYAGRSIPATDLPTQSAIIVEDTTNAATTSPRETPDNMRQRPGAVTSVATGHPRANAPDFSWLVSSELFDPYGHGDRWRSGKSSPWRVGMCLPGLAAASRQGADTMNEGDAASSPAVPPSGLTTPPGPRRDFEPTPAITREQMRRELMGNSGGPIL